MIEESSTGTVPSRSLILGVSEAVGFRGIIGIRGTDICSRLEGSLCRLFSQRGISSDSNDVTSDVFDSTCFVKSDETVLVFILHAIY